MQKQFRPGLVPGLAYTVFLLLLLSLGNWQMNRAGEKEQLFQAFESGDTQALTIKSALDKPQPRYQRVMITGRFLADQQYLLDNIVRKGQVGLYVLTPFESNDQQSLIVNRGWIPLSIKQGPKVELARMLKMKPQTLTLTGRLDKLPRPGLLLEAQIPDTLYPKTVQFPTFGQLEADLKTDLVAWQILLDPVQSQAQDIGFMREWTPNEIGPERHIGYAVQWFALAFTLTVIFLLLSFRPRSENRDHTTPDNESIEIK